MSLSRSFTNNSQLTDYTDEILKIPNVWGLFNNMGLFEQEGVTQHTITFERTTEVEGVILDQVRGVRNTYGRDADTQVHAYPVPHFPIDDYITVDDVQGVRRNGTADQEETVANARSKKLLRLRRMHAQTKEMVLAKAIQGEIYNPNGTIGSVNVYTDFGLTRLDVDYDLGTPATNIVEKGESVIAEIQDQVQDGSVLTDIVAVCSPEFFSALVSHPTLAEAYKHYENTGQVGNAQVLRDRLGVGLNRMFSHGGITYIEYRGSYAGTTFIPAGDAYFFPLGTMDIFKVYNSPAYKLSLANTIGEELYVFEQEIGNDTGWKIESEQNILALVRKPEIVVRGFSST